MSIRIRPLHPGEAALLRELRLRALDDAPDAFGQTRFEAAGLPPEHWERAAERYTAAGGDALFLALPDRPSRTESPAAVGSVAIRRDGRRPDETGHLGFLWAAPEWRRTGVGAALTSAALHWCRRQTLREVRVWAPHGGAAYRLFARAGFAATGLRFPQPGAPATSLCELRFAINLEPAASPSEAATELVSVLPAIL